MADDRASTWQREITVMVVTLLCALAGSVIASRDRPALEVVVEGCVFAALAAAVVSGARSTESPSPLTFNLGIASIAGIVFYSFFGNAVAALVPGVLCALPFAISGYFLPRHSSSDDALYAAIAGSSLSLFPAMFVIFIACLTSLAVARVRGLPNAAVRFFPYVAGYLIVGLTIQIALSE